MGDKHLYVHVVSAAPGQNLTILKTEKDILIRLCV